MKFRICLLFNLFLCFILIIPAKNLIAKQKWKGKIRKEKGIIIIENKGNGIYGKDIKNKISFKEILSIGVEEGPDYLMFGNYIKVDVDQEENVYILDSQNSRVLKFDKNGKFLWQVGRKGQGPGEFEYPEDLIITENELIVAESTRIHYFDKNGNFKKTYRMEKPIKGIIACPDNQIIASLLITGQVGVGCAFFTKEGKLIRIFKSQVGKKIFEDRGKNKAKLIWGGGYVNIFKNSIYICLPEKYEIQVYAMDGKLIKKIFRDIKIKPAEVQVFEGGGGFVMDMDEVGPIYFLKDGTLIVKLRLAKGEGKDFHYEYYLDFFNKDFKFLGSYPVAKDMDLVKADSFNNFYFLQKYPFPKIIKCTLEMH
ncbi:6-bladed beta-propeller [Candidatus Aminicenantes bacterium AC-708-M15]|jgi:hypothetical protein|nr:6-bladed beta-propeller [SCandidatus Aminicenantes bacterium Aminicenantia_JdfR_composite]MCP2597110.1 6-bladed beta-propeller [Candidatus Aminicenantes bacterium AC-335-G13]MCP2598235.1 6-bladed beta-propeller [Candidatus Aminicenantes bacterium AC-335-L06]MCP2598868.1 6-bladed beta-propeller [Candidatus Aminicenantes bacterium AC-335-B20]MCP2604360.1 6-bladed beta-propeller [Candidatus Aminicenantes bacterium AC-708-M15]MCP2618665.1 6-bladed beta-propeller [Candidatus Aminicenantes bacter